MASITFSGQLDQAMNEAAAEGNKILFIPQQTVGEVLPGAASELVVESDGTYSITLAYNTYSIYHYSDVTKRKTLLATDIVVSSDTVVTTIPDLIGSTVPVTEDSVLAIQGYLTEANTAKTDAEASAETATEAAAAIISPWADTADLAHEPSFSNFAKTDDMFIESYGQSLALGSQGTPVISTTQNYNNVMFASGVKRISGTDYSEFVDLVETVTSQYGETPVTSITNYLSENDDDYTSDGTRYIGSASGLGGQPIYNLNRGSTIYSYLMDRIQAAKDLSDADSRSFSVPVIFWTQGEADYNGETDYRSYIESLTNLHSDLLEDVTSVTGQDYLPYMVTYQMGSHRAYGENTPTIALAIKEVCDNTQGFGIACPLYSFEHYTDNIHLTNDSYYSLGQYYGKAAKDLMNYGKVQNCHIKSAVCNGYTIMVDVNVPAPPLVIDTDNVAEAIGYGFYIKSISQGLDSSNNLINMVTGVEVVNDTQLKITVDEEIPSDARLVYAHGRPIDTATSGPTTGPRGNIRDSQGETWNWTTPTNGTYRRGDNWLLVDDVVIEHLDPKDLFEDFDGDVVSLIESAHAEIPSLSIPFNESGRLDYGVGTEYVSGLPVYGVDFTRSTSCYYINKSGLVDFADVDEIAIGKDGAILHGAVTNLCLSSGDVTDETYWTVNSNVDYGGTDSGLGIDLQYIIPDTVDTSHFLRQQSISPSSQKVTATLFFKKSSDYSMRIMVREGTNGYRVTQNFTMDTLEIGEIQEVGGCVIDNFNLQNLGDYARAKLQLTFPDGVDISNTQVLISLLEREDYSTTSPSNFAGDGVTGAYLGAVELLDVHYGLDTYIPTTSTSSTITATSCTVPVNGNLPAAGESFTIVCDSYVDGSSSASDYSAYYTIGSNSADYVGLAQSRTGTLRVQHSLGSWISANAVSTNSLSRLAVTCEIDLSNDSTTLSVYQDGNLISSQSFSGSFVDIVSYDFKIGAATAGVTNLNQQIKNFKVLPYAASAVEVKSWGAPK